jgi:hypothetical protein
MTRWFAWRFGVTRLACVALVVGLAALRIADFPAIEEIRVRTFDIFQLIEPRVKTARPVAIVETTSVRRSKRIAIWRGLLHFGSTSTAGLPRAGKSRNGQLDYPVFTRFSDEAASSE